MNICNYALLHGWLIGQMSPCPFVKVCSTHRNDVSSSTYLTASDHYVDVLNYVYINILSY